jgi:hypothetical protein
MEQTATRTPAPTVRMGSFMADVTLPDMKKAPLKMSSFGLDVPLDKLDPGQYICQLNVVDDAASPGCRSSPWRCALAMTQRWNCPALSQGPAETCRVKISACR